MSSHEKRRGAHTNMTLADLIGLIANDPTLEDNRRRWCTAMEGIARGLGKPPSILPADPKKLIALLSKEQGAQRRADVAKSTWTTYTAQYRAATRHVGLAPGPARVDTPRSPAWRELLATRTRSECNYLSRFAGMMTEQRVEPSQVTAVHFETYRDYVHAAAVREPRRLTMVRAGLGHGSLTTIRNSWNARPRVRIGAVHTGWSGRHSRRNSRPRSMPTTLIKAGRNRLT